MCYSLKFKKSSPAQEGRLMACINPDGTLTKSAKSLLSVIDTPHTAEALSKTLATPLFLVRASLREMVNAKLIRFEGDTYVITETGKEALSIG
jgi:hypothetical protein